MKGGSEAIELKLRKIEKIDANSYKCDDVESALAPAKNGGIWGKACKNKSNSSERQDTTTKTSTAQVYTHYDLQDKKNYSNTYLAE